MKLLLQAAFIFVTAIAPSCLICMNTTRVGTKLDNIAHEPIDSAQFINQHILITTSEHTKKIKQIDLKTGEEKIVLDKEYTCYTANSNGLVYASPRNGISLLTTLSKKPEYIASIPKDQLESTVAALKISLDSKLLAVALCNNAVRLYDITQKEPLKISVWEEHKKTQPKFTKTDSFELIKKTSILLFSNGTDLLVRSSNGALTLFGIALKRDKDCLTKLSSVEIDVQKTGGEQKTATLSHDNQILITCSNTHVTMWDISDKKRIELIQSVQNESHKQAINTVLFGPSSWFFFTACDDQTIGIWECFSRDEELYLSRCTTSLEHEGPIIALCTNKEGAKLLSCSDTTEIRSWDIETFCK